MPSEFKLQKHTTAPLNKEEENHYEKAWRIVSKHVINSVKQEFKHMIKSYKINDSKIDDKAKEFTIGRIKRDHIISVKVSEVVPPL